MMTERPSIETVMVRLRDFAQSRDWDQFHSPKNLVMALTGEVGELTEHFQWLTESESNNLSERTRSAVALEMSDVFLYLLRLSDVLNVDLVETSLDKLDMNDKKYPVELSKGNAKKYTEL